MYDGPAEAADAASSGAGCVAAGAISGATPGGIGSAIDAGLAATGSASMLG